jgi:hypothetical protein
MFIGILALWLSVDIARYADLTIVNQYTVLLDNFNNDLKV